VIDDFKQLPKLPDPLDVLEAWANNQAETIVGEPGMVMATLAYRDMAGCCQAYLTIPVAVIYKGKREGWWT